MKQATCHCYSYVASIYVAYFKWPGRPGIDAKGHKLP
jgi:hypothetical protein